MHIITRQVRYYTFIISPKSASDEDILQYYLLAKTQLAQLAQLYSDGDRVSLKNIPPRLPLEEEAT
jgi:hypothetical protein